MTILLIFGLALAAPSPAIVKPDYDAVIQLTGDMARERRDHSRALAGLQRKHEQAKRHPGKQEERLNLEFQIYALNSHHASMMDDLLQRTMSLYGIRPSRQRGTVVVPGPFRGAAVRWEPRFGSGALQRTVVTPSGTTIPLQVDPYEAVIWADGQVEITEEAFRSPGYLAALLLHESVHFDQYVTPGRGDRFRGLQLELEAHSQSSGRNNAAILGLTADELARIRRIHTAQIEAFQRHPDLLMMSMQFRAAEEARRSASDSFVQSGAAAAPLASPYQPAGPAPDYAPPNLVAPRAQTPPLAAANRAPDMEVIALAAAACREDWTAASSLLTEYFRLSAGDLVFLGRHASTETNLCHKALLSRIIVMRQADEVLDLPRLQSETQAVRNPPIYDEPLERPDRRPGGCIKRGVWFPQC